MIRGLAAALAVLLFAAPLAEAQPPGKIPRIGVLRPGNPPPGDFGHREAVEGGLRELGWTPGTSRVENDITGCTDGSVDDEEVAMEVAEELAADPARTGVGVEVSGGCVKLIGQVPTAAAAAGARCFKLAGSDFPAPPCTSTVEGVMASSGFGLAPPSLHPYTMERDTMKLA